MKFNLEMIILWTREELIEVIQNVNSTQFY